jgi:ParB-like chromosome segregation protein Spo0J
MKIEQIALDELIPYANNARTHSEEQVLQIASSIKEFGFNAPVLIDKDKGIIAGHGRVMAAKKLGLKQAPCIRLEHLTEPQKKAYILADNRIALNSEWNIDFLKIELETLKEFDFDLTSLGFDKSELNFEEINYDFVNQEDLDNQMQSMASGVRKAIQIEFEPEHYEEAFQLVKFWRDQGGYVGMMLLDYLKAEKAKL